MPRPGPRLGYGIAHPSLVQAILTGPKKDHFNAMCTKHAHIFVDLMAGSMRPLVEHMIGEKEFREMKDEIGARMIESLPVAIR